MHSLGSKDLHACNVQQSPPYVRSDKHANFSSSLLYYITHPFHPLFEQIVVGQFTQLTTCSLLCQYVNIVQSCFCKHRQQPVQNMALNSSLIAKNQILSQLKQNQEMELFVFVHLDLSGLFLNSMFSYIRQHNI